MEHNSQQSDSKINLHKQQQPQNTHSQNLTSQNPMARLSTKHICSTGNLDKVVVNPLLKPDEDNKFIILTSCKNNPKNERYENGQPLKNKKLPPIGKHINNQEATLVEIQQKRRVSPQKPLFVSVDTNKTFVHKNSVTVAADEDNKLQIIKILPNDPNFLYQSILPGFLLEGTVNRIRMNRNQSHNQYQFTVSDSREQILMGMPRTCRTNSFYEIRKQGQMIATLQSNFSGSKFQLRSKKQNKVLCTIQYQSNMCTNAETRVFRVTITRQELVLETQLPTYNKFLDKYTLFFNKRANLSSLKNFILVEPTEPKHNIVLLGKMNKDQFSLDVSSGVSPLEAFGIALSSFDPKMVCQ